MIEQERKEVYVTTVYNEDGEIYHFFTCDGISKVVDVLHTIFKDELQVENKGTEDELAYFGSSANRITVLRQQINTNHSEVFVENVEVNALEYFVNRLHYLAKLVAPSQMKLQKADFGDIYTIKDFADLQLMYYDGSGFYGTAKGFYHLFPVDWNNIIETAKARDFTHVWWFNK